ncbi:ABC transporter permease [Catellatospora citrea]|uniref:Membrane protein n=1 Tax=Catellatospora citrea TaxID=53366 RepID=A0A8J3KNJ2_9ACTN|nr:ABC transporter permease subunit [Catellatospora citrea]RKE06165.1 ABC-2 type transport system permease protein [Catellatospora citrea]GIG00504.1 membrane protein [Catellatospora citrea]
MSDQSVIHDIGYQRYTGTRLGRGYAARSLFEHGLRIAFGLGRSAKAKIFPWIVIGMVCALAVIVVAIKAQTGEMVLSYQQLPSTISVVAMVFLAVVAPELVSRDLRNQTLPLYFSRPIRRSDYALAKLAALVVAVWLLLAGPQTLIFLGSAFTAADASGIAAEARGLLGGWVVSALYALIFSSLAVLIASIASRRAFAAGAIVVVFMVTSPVVGLLMALGGDGPMAQIAPMFSPFLLPEGVRQWLYGTSFEVGPYGPVYGLVTLLLVAGCTSLLVLRYRKVSL